RAGYVEPLAARSRPHGAAIAVPDHPRRPVAGAGVDQGKRTIPAENLDGAGDMTYRRAVEPEERGGQSLALGDGLTVPGAHNLDRQPFRHLEDGGTQNRTSNQSYDPL